MKLTIDSDREVCLIEGEDGRRELPLYSDDAFREIARWYMKVGWNQRYGYSFSWLGRPLIQLPDDTLRIQEVIDAVRPDVIVETGVAHGGSLVYYASLLEALGHGEVVGVDIEIRPANRAAIEAHPLARRITLVEGSSTEPSVVERVARVVAGKGKVLVILDSNHSYVHVSEELRLYAPFITPGSYIVATDGAMEDLWDTPRGHPSWRTDNPARAARDFAAANPSFRLETPAPPFDESTLAGSGPTHWPSAWLRRL